MSAIRVFEPDFLAGMAPSGSDGHARNGGVSFDKGAFSEACTCCGGNHARYDFGDFGALAFLNGDDRGATGTNGKPSLSIVDAGARISRENLSWANSLGTAATVTFAFRASAPTKMPSDTAGFTTFTNPQIAATLTALQAWSDVANIIFTRVQDTSGYSNNASILFGNYSSGEAGSAAFAYNPGNRSSTSASGDVWVNSSITNNINPALLNYGQQTLTHEIGHAIGLSHPADYNAGEGVTITYANDAVYYEDSRQYTVMSYFSEVNTGGSFRSGVSQYSSVPLLDDIAASQRLYGANMATRTGDTVYGFNSNADRSWFVATSASTSLIFAIWDAGGTDTLDFSGYTQNQVIDLRQGGFSNVGGLIGNVAIAAGAVIENAIGGSGSDIIRGNSANNRIVGNGGNDQIDGGLGTDTVVFTGARSAYTITWTGQSGVVVGNGQNATVTNVEFLAFTDQTIAAAATGGLVVSGDLTNDTMTGTAFTDVLSGGGGDDTLNGLGGDDVLNGGYGADTISGGDGDDRLAGGLGNDRLDGGNGIDFADYSGATAGVTVNLSSGTALGADGNDILINIESVRGSGFADVLIGDAGNNTLRGGGGADVIYGGDGNDVFYSGVAGLTAGAPDIIKTRTVVNGNQSTAVSLDGGFDLLQKAAVVSSTTTPHATVVATSSGSEEWYSFSAVSGSSVVIDIDDASFDSVIRVYNSAGTLIGTNDDGATQGDLGNRTDSTLTFTAPADGIYYVEVSEWVSNDPLATKGITAGGTYALHVSAPGHSVVPIIESGSSLYGEAGDDAFYQGFDVDGTSGGSANDVIDGGSGTDTVFYNGLFANFTIAVANGVTTVRGLATGTDTLANVERVQFNDRLVTFGTTTEIVGSAGNDVLIGTAGADVIRGLGGDDLLTGAMGSDLLDGGAGFDAALYSGVRRQYVASSATVSGNGEGTDTLAGIEEARFVDGVLTFDVLSASAQIMRLYSATLNRTPDQAGLEANVGGLARIGLQAMADTFVASAEFQARFGALSNQQFVEQLYMFALGRTGDPGGIAGWVGSLNAGGTRGQVVLGFSESLEHQNRTAATLNAGLWVPDAQAQVIARLYDATFDRLPDVGGLAGWTTALKSGTPLTDIAAAFAGSAEFQARYGALSNQAFVEQLYRFCLNREGEAGGIAGWVATLNAGTSRASVLSGFSESAEHIALTAASWLGGIRYVGYVGASLEGVYDQHDGPQVLPGIDSHDLSLTDKAHDVQILPVEPDHGVNYNLADLGLTSLLDEAHDAFVLPTTPDGGFQPWIPAVPNDTGTIDIDLSLFKTVDATPANDEALFHHDISLTLPTDPNPEDLLFGFHKGGHELNWA